MTVQSKTISPTASYTLEVPANVLDVTDDRTISLYVPGDDTLLQISSFSRDEGSQVPASARLQERLLTTDMGEPELIPLAIPAARDTAAALLRDEEGVRWLFVYVVWPELAVLLTVSHPKASPLKQEWAMNAVRSIRLRAG